MLRAILLSLLCTIAVSAQVETIDRAQIDAARVRWQQADVTTADQEAALERAAIAVGQVDRRRQAIERARELRDQAASAPERAAQARDRLAREADIVRMPGTSIGFATLTGLLRSARERQEETRREAAEIAERLADIESRRTTWPADVERLRTESQQANELAGGPDQAGILQEAHELVVQATRAACAAELDALAAERETADARATTLELENRVLQRVLDAQTFEIERIRRFVNLDELSQLDRAIEDAEASLSNARAGTEPLLVRLVALHRDRRQIAADRQETQALTWSARRRRETLTSAFDSAKARTSSVAWSSTVGSELRRLRREQRRHVEELEQAVQSRAPSANSASEKRFDLEDRLRELRDLEGAAAIQFPLTTDPNLLETVRDLLRRELNLLEDVAAECRQLVSAFTELKTLRGSLQDEQDELEAFVAQHVLWIPSSRGISSLELERVAQDMTTAGDRWRSDLSALMRGLDAPSPLWLGLVWLAAMLALRRHLLRSLTALGETAQRRTTVAFGPTRRAALITLLLSATWPVFFFACVADLEQRSAGPALGLALTRAAWLTGLVSMMSVIARPGGLAHAHFGWSPSSCAKLRRSSRRLALPVVALSSIAAATQHHDDEYLRDTVGRLASLTSILLAGFALGGLLHPSHGLLKTHWTPTWRRIAYVAAWSATVLLAVLSLTGYVYTAEELFTRVLATEGLILATIAIHHLALRRALLTRRALAIAEARKRRAERLANVAEPELPTENAPAHLDLAEVDRQTRKIIVLAAWATGLLISVTIWSDVLPALAVLDSVELWFETTTEESGNSLTVPITLGDVLAASVLVAVTWAIAKNLAGFLELTVLRHTKLGSGERYALATVLRYIVVVVGAVFAFSQIGLGWGKVQWLAAGVSVGLGFGLQEIFANFVSGLILLFERPVRVGDYVTIGETDGKVTRIRMRATTVMDWNRKELIVPNREFVTGRVVNWSLSSPILRIVIPVGIAYGSDTDRAMELLKQCAVDCSKVLADPAPHVIYRRFGDSTLDFELRIFIASMDDWQEAMNTMHRSIDQAFRAADIEIAFPQRDLHIRSIQGGVSLEPATPPNQP